MRFSVDAHAIGRKLTGNEVFIRNLLHGFAAQDKTSDFVAYLSSREASASIPRRFAWRVVAENPFARLGYDLPRQVRRDAPDLLHVQYTAPVRCPVPVVVNVHDVSFLEHPEYFPTARAMQLRWTVVRTMKSAARVVTPSEFSRKAILRNCRLDESKISVVPYAVSGSLRPLPRENSRAQVEARYGIDGPYILTVGDLQPRKNQTGLIHAFEDLIREYPQLPHRLVMVGKDSWYGPRVRRQAAASPLGHRIHFTGFVSDDDLLPLYGGCDLFVFPSFYEGFGLPVLEAMACARAVACSNTSALPEVADAAAILFDPSSRGEMVRAMRDILLDAELRQRLERLGQQNAALFSWDETARRHLEVYYEVARVRKPAPVALSSLAGRRS
ncbi:MAG: glycosyltransferase family 4 protein [Bryobacteraceae bacterium]